MLIRKQPGIAILLAAVLLSSAITVTQVAVSMRPATAVVPGANGRLVFSRQICSTEDDPCWEIVVASADNTEETVVAGPYPRGVWDDHFVANWAPDGQSVIFMADLGAGQAIWQVNGDGTDFHKVFAAPEGTFLDDGPSFTPDGTAIIFTRCCLRTGYSLWRIQADGTRLRIVTREVIGAKTDAPSDNLPQVSPDGRQITFHRNNCQPDGCHGIRIATVGVAGGQLREITPEGLDAQIPNWSPDGQRIVFESFSDDGVAVWAVNPDGSELTQLTFDGFSLAPSYSPDGTKIVLDHRTDLGERDLFTLNPDGTGLTRITHTDAVERFPQWAPVPVAS